MGEDALRMPAAFKALQKSKQEEVGHIVSVNGENPALLKLPRNTGNLNSPSVESLTGDTDANTYNEFDFNDNPEVRSHSLSSVLGQFSINASPEQHASATTITNQLLQQRSTEASPVPTRGILSRDVSTVTVPGENSFNSSPATTARTNARSATGSADSMKLRFANHTVMSASNAPAGTAVTGQEAHSQQRLLAFASTTSFHTGIDRYGFKKPTTGITDIEFDKWSSNYSRYMSHREEKWNALLRANGLNPGTATESPVRFPSESLKLRRYVRKGIPPKWRGNAWFWYARGHEKLNAHPGLYEKLVKETEDLKNSDIEHIERDLHRTFPDNIYFRNDPITNEESSHLKSLRKVLTCFSVYHPKIGYCQSLNFIAGNLLLFIEEERAFWMLVIITQNYLSGLHEVNLEQVNISQGVLMISVRDRLPKIWNALNLEQSLEDNFVSNLPPISLCTAPWFMSLMVNVLPTETMLRVWDCVFLEGPKTLYRISLTIFKLVEPLLTKATDELEVFQVIQSSPKELYDPEILMKACFKRANGFGHISNDDIALLRSFVMNRRKQALEGPDSTTTDRHAYAKLHRGRRVRAKLSLYR